VLLSTHVKASRRKGRWSTINLVAMTKTTRAQFLNKMLGWWWMLIWTQHHRKLLGGKFVYELKVLLGYQRILDLRSV
jgi:hypothetical protein